MKRPPENDPPTDELDSGRETIDVPLTRPPVFLTRNRLLKSLSEDVLALIHSRMTEQRFRAGEALITQGDPGTSLMLLTSGKVEVSVEEGETRHTIKRIGPGEIIGEMALLTKEPRNATVRAVTPVRASILAAADFDEMAGKHPKISALLTLLLASRLGRVQHDALTGQTFEGYRILQCLGRGGMSVVYEAQEAGSPRRVALKMMSHRLLFDPAAMAHFMREAEIVLSFNHPNIAKMYGRFEAYRTSFIVMELCEGISISRVMSSQAPLPEPEVRKLVGQVASAIMHAHGAGIVHRDIKPSNIMVTREGTVKLIDFGLAGQIDKDAVTPALFGTPHYMAPEQMTGGLVGKTIDLFALGHVAYEMLTGVRLFEGDDFWAIREQVMECRTPDFSKDPAGVSPEFRRVLQGLLMKDPAERSLDFEKVRSWAGPVDVQLLEERVAGSE